VIGIKRIDESTKNDINMPNEPFALWGKMIPIYDGSTWSFRIEKFEKHEITEMVFPDEYYDFDSLKKECIIVGACNEHGKCVGLAIYKKDPFKYIYLEDIKIKQEYRGHGIGKSLIDEGMKIAKENNYQGIYTIGQDNNLSACTFYIKSGFVIGGLNTHVYKGTNQANKSNIYFYLDV
jgi:ribosomal protein S18 acetylase RimI-like enzyme